MRKSLIITAVLAVAVVLTLVVPNLSSGVEFGRSGLCPYYVQLSPGESENVTFVVNNEGGGGGTVEVEVYRVEGASWTTTERAPPTDEVSVEPEFSEFVVKPGGQYGFAVEVSADPDVEPTGTGKGYTFLVRMTSDGETFDDWLFVWVSREGVAVPGWPFRPPESYLENHVYGTESCGELGRLPEPVSVRVPVNRS